MSVLLRFISTCVAAIVLTNSSKVGVNRLNLISYLFNKSRYDKRIMPSNENGPLNVTLGLTIFKIDDLEEINQQLVTHAIFHQTWKDPHLVWNPQDFNGTEFITVKARQIWFPDIVLFNSAAAGFAKGLMRTHGLLSYNGTLVFNIISVFHTLCTVNVDSYPIDKQECQLTFGSWGHNGRLIVVNSNAKNIDLSSYVVNGEWELEKTSLKQNLKSYDGGYPYYDITFSVTIRRRILYYAMYLIIPGTLIALLASTVFVLPLDCSERVTVGMAVLVALSFFFLLVSENMPASAKIPLIGGYYAVTMVQMAISFFLNVLVLRFHHMTDNDVPDWVKKYILHHGARFLRMDSHGEIQERKEEKRRETSDDEKDLSQDGEWEEEQIRRSEEEWSLMNEENGVEESPAIAEEHNVEEDANGSERNKYEMRKLSNKKEISVELYVANKVITSIAEHREKMALRNAEWKKAAEILNNLAFILHLCAVFTIFAGVFLKKIVNQ